MITTSDQLGKKKQRGIALLVFVILIAITISSYYFSSISIVDIQVDEAEENHELLKKAKAALINYAIMHADGISSGDAGEFGYLPCPHININGTTDEGIQQIPSCGGGGLNAIGYLPWKTLGIGDLRDSSGNCLWYAVSSSYKNAVYSGLINEDTNGMFQVVDENGVVLEGNSPEDRIVAIVFAPGPTLGAQDHRFDPVTPSLCGNDGFNPQEYLEGNAFTDNGTLVGIVDELDQFIHATLTSDKEAAPYNDHFITITRDEIWQAILLRNDLQDKLRNLTEALALCVSDYAATVSSLRLPWPAPMALLDYRDENKYSDAASYAGRFPYEVDNSNTVITGAASAELFTQANCNSLGGVPVDLLTPNSEYRNLWNNWKDHFFYVVSEDFAPAGTDGSCGNCIEYNGNDMAAIVIFSGFRNDIAGQLRNGPVAPGDVNTKDDISNYIENNVIAFNSGSGTASYVPGGNDIMYCVKPDLTVDVCPP